jgi:N-acetylmuramoyl-L-alanine amidase
MDRVAGAAAIFIILCVIIGNIGSCSHNQNNDPTIPTDNTVTTDNIQTSETVAEDTELVVCIDAGHGGDDPGSLASYTERYEKDDNLAIALSVQKHLQQIQNVDIKIIMTREDDTFISLDDRCTIANLADADLFVSLHRNSAENANGVEVWVHNEEPQPDCRLAYNILVALEDIGISKNKGVRFGFISDPNENYQVNRETDMPSCLVELGFMDSPEDNNLLDTHLDDYGDAIANAIIKTAKELELKGLEPDNKNVEPIETEYYNYEVSDYVPNPDIGEH